MFRSTLALRGSLATFVALILSVVANRCCAAAEQHSAPVRSGAVIIDGQFVEGPFIVDAVGAEVTINGFPVGLVARDSVTESSFADEPANAVIADVERLLLLNGLLLRQGQAVLLLPGFESSDGGSLLSDVIATLTSDASGEDKLRLLAMCDFPETRHMTTKRWMELIDLFQASPELATQVISCGDPAMINPMHAVGLNDAILDEGVEIATGPAVAEAVDISESVQYCVNLFGMLAGVIALRSLLSSRPETDR